MSKLKVVELHPKVDQDTVDHCADLLRMARAGEITSIAFAAEKPDGMVLTAKTRWHDPVKGLGAVYRLAHLFNTNLDENAEDLGFPPRAGDDDDDGDDHIPI